VKTVLIYKTELLHLSETFIEAQARALKIFRPQFVGLRRAAKSLVLPNDAIILTKNNRVSSRLQILLYRILGIAPSFMRTLQAVKPALLHSHFATESITALPIADHLNIPLIVTLHGADVTVNDSAMRDSFGGRLYLRGREQLQRRASLFICVSEFIKQKAIEKGFPREKLYTHYIGIDRGRFAPSGQQRKGESILFVGRLTEKKGCQYLLRAVALVQQKRSQARVTILGDGPLRSSLEVLARQLRVRCTFLGAQPADVIRQHLEATRILCVPSVTAANGDSEGLGMVFAEAQCMGVPVVSFAHGGIPEIVENGKTGLLAPEFDYTQLANHILTYLTEDGFWRQSAEQGAERIRTGFDLEAQTAKLEVLYAKVIAEFDRRHPRVS
jgi:colanic acid/amylovoran biosynthesis glycosyltransferase